MPIGDARERMYRFTIEERARLLDFLGAAGTSIPARDRTINAMKRRTGFTDHAFAFCHGAALGMEWIDREAIGNTIVIRVTPLGEEVQSLKAMGP